MFFAILPTGPLYRIELITCTVDSIALLFLQVEIVLLGDTGGGRWFESLVGETSGKSAEELIFFFF